MKLISVEQARAVWLFPLTDLNPRGTAIEKDGLTEIRNRYEFAVAPGPAEIVAARETQQPLKYLQGSFTPKKRKEAITVDLLLYRDGIIADTRSSTTDSDEFIGDLLNWATKELGLLPHEEIVRSKGAVSSLYVTSAKPMSLLNPKLEAFSKILTENVSGQNSGAKLEFASFGFWPDQNLINPPAPFRFERAAGALFSENRYYSLAPINTEKHIDLLNELEKLLAS